MVFLAGFAAGTFVNPNPFAVTVSADEITAVSFFATAGHNLRIIAILVAGGFVLAMLCVGAFSTAHTLNILFNTQLPEIDESLAWAADAGLVIGAAVAFFVGFAAWLYLSFGTFVVLRIRTRELSAAVVTRRTGLAFVFPLVGFVVSLVLAAVWTPGVAATALYAASAVYGLAVLAKALADAESAPLGAAVVAVATPIIVAVVSLALLAFLYLSIAPVETQP